MNAIENEIFITKKKIENIEEEIRVNKKRIEKFQYGYDLIVNKHISRENHINDYLSSINSGMSGNESKYIILQNYKSNISKIILNSHNALLDNEKQKGIIIKNNIDNLINKNNCKKKEIEALKEKITNLRKLEANDKN